MAMPEVRQLLADAARRLGGESPRLDAELLLAHVLQRPRAWLYAHADDTLGDVELATFNTLLNRRCAGEPVAYLIGRRGFWSLDLQVTPATLIPRPETELLVELALQRIPTDARIDIADLGTGSGAIALAIARERPLAQVWATDMSEAALAVARSNAQSATIANVHFVQGDWCEALGDGRFDVIVSNPPYIATDDSHVRQGDLRFEPIAALVSGKDGLDAIRQIVGEAPGHLKPGGALLFEHGYDQGLAARELLRAAGYTDVATAVDIEGRDRVTGGIRHSPQRSA
jgi:release factor glutamine methyltransferase